jgi:putative ABC transport system permease protein
LPGVRAAAAVNHIPVGGDEWGVNFHVPGVTPEAFDQRPRAVLRVADPHFLSAMGIPLLRGRNFTEAGRPGSQPVVLINQALAKRWFDGSDPVGRPMLLGRAGRRLAVVGVYADTRQTEWGRPAEPEVLLPLAQESSRFNSSFVIHTGVDPASMFESVRRAIAGFDPTLAAVDMATMGEIRFAAVARPRFSLTLLAVLASVTLALAVVGLFAVISYSVASRLREFGIRSALGAGTRRLHTQILGEGLLPVFAGAMVGVGGALLLMRRYRELLYRVDPADPGVLLGALALILMVAAAACWMPARRASRVHPASVLRDE